MVVKSKTNLFMDLAIFLALVAAMAPRFTGMAIHEWLSLIFAAAIVVHILFHWNWIITIGKTFIKKLLSESRLNFAVDLVFFLSLIVIMVSGIAISKVALPAMGISLPFAAVWKRVHSISADIGLIALGVHCALHGTWIVNQSKAYLIAPLIRLFKKDAFVHTMQGGK